MDKLLARYQGYYEEESLTNNSGYTSYDLGLRVPAKNFDDFLQEVQTGEDLVTSKSIRAEDVSVQFLDVESRLKSKRAYLEKYQQMVRSSKSVKDLLEIQEQIRTLQEDIEANDAVLRSLSQKINYSYLKVILFQKDANLPIGSKSFWVRVVNSFKFGWDLIKTLTVGLIGIWPLLLIFIPLVYWLSRVRERRRNRRIK